MPHIRKYIRNVNEFEKLYNSSIPVLVAELMLKIKKLDFLNNTKGFRLSRLNLIVMEKKQNLKVFNNQTLLLIILEA